MTDLRDKIVGALDIEGAFCGTCDREPGDSLYCTACVRVLNGYADAVLAVLDVGEIRAEAWDQGLSAGLRECNDKTRGVVNNPALNPYRKAEQ